MCEARLCKAAVHKPQLVSLALHGIEGTWAASQYPQTSKAATGPPQRPAHLRDSPSRKAQEQVGVGCRCMSGEAAVVRAKQHIQRRVRAVGACSQEVG